MVPDQEMSSGRMIGPYRIDKRLGAGGMGVVFRGFDQRLDRPVALKNIKGENSSLSARERFRREARAAARLSHPSIVQVYDLVEGDEGDWIVMELVEGDNLKDLLEASPLAPERAAVLSKQILSGLQVAHSAGIVHRDLKADNIMLTSMDQVKILDFGLAKHIQADNTEPAITVAGRLMGTISSMSPEQALGTEIDHRSDLFSLGILMYEMITGISPFHSDNRMQTLTRICTLQHRPAVDIRPKVPAALSHFVDALLEKEPENRPQSAAEAILSLEKIIEQRQAEKRQTESASGFFEVPHLPASTTDGSGSSATLSDTVVEGAGSSTHGVPYSGRSASVTRPPYGSGSHTGTGSSPAIPAKLTPPPGVALSEDKKPQITIRKPRIHRPPAGEKIDIVFRNEDGGDKTTQFNSGRRRTLLELALAHEIPLFHECGGRARCSTCRVRILENLDNVQPRSAQEAKLAERMGWEDNIRLGCQARVTGPAVVERLVRDTQDVGLLLDEQTQTLPAQEMTLALLSCELLDFDAFSEKAPPYDQIHLLHRFLSQIGSLVSAYGGRIQSYSSAGFRAFFGLDGGSAVEKCLSAVRAGLRAADRMVVFNRYSESYFGTELRLGVGLHFARMVVGQVGGFATNRPLLAIGEATQLVDMVSRHNDETATTILATEEMINVIEEQLTIGNILPDEAVGDEYLTLYEVYDLEHPDTTFIVQTTFERLSAYNEQAAGLFYRTLFDLEPGVRSLFKDTDMREQGQKFMSMLTTVVNGFDHLEQISPYLKRLGDTHRGYGVEPEHYDIVGQALLTTVEQITGNELDLSVRHAWEHFYAQIVDVMLEEEVQ